MRARLFNAIGWAALAVALVLGTGCQSMPENPLPTVDQVDLQRFAGDWYVIAHIPARIEREAYNAVESYALADDGSIATTYSFRKGGFDGPEKRYHPRGYVREGTGNAVWGMQFIWPFKAEYLIVYLDEGYTVTVIGRNKRDYVWIMARTPELPAARYEEIVEFLAANGYDIDNLRRVPQRWD